MNQTSKQTVDFTLYEPEAHRLKFLYERDGLDGALQFAEQTMMIYRRHVVSGSVARDLRASFIQSYLAFKGFLHDHRNRSDGTSSS